MKKGYVYMEVLLTRRRNQQDSRKLPVWQQAEQDENTRIFHLSFLCCFCPPMFRNAKQKKNRAWKLLKQCVFEGNFKKIFHNFERELATFKY